MTTAEVPARQTPTTIDYRPGSAAARPKSAPVSESRAGRRKDMGSVRLMADAEAAEGEEVV